jgi:leucyl aminopeptidase
MSFILMGYPSAFASEGNPMAGHFDPYVHGVNDTMDVDDEHGFFSLDVSDAFFIFFFLDDPCC